MPVRRRRARRSASSSPEVDALVWHGTPAARPGPALRLPRARAVRPEAGPALQPRQAAARPVREGHRGPDRLGRVAVLATASTTPTPSTTHDSRGHTMPRPSSSTRSSTGATTGRRGTPYHETVIYEAHVKGLTMRTRTCPRRSAARTPRIGAPGDHRAPARELGVTAVELMPVHQFVQDDHLRRQGPVELLGLQHDRLLRPAQRLRLERPARPAGAGVQGDGARPCTRPASRSSSTSSTTTPPRATTSARRCRFRGIDNAAYYRLVDGRPARTTTTPPAPATACNMRHPHVLQLIMDSLRYWVTEMHVDGFRFDLAVDAGPRSSTRSTGCRAFFDLVQQDPVVSQVKLIAEPWDVGEGGYQVGNFPPLWTEWNGKYRDTVRDFWRGEPATLGEFASRLTGSSRPLRGRRPPAASRRINFVTAHDGFTLHDLVSYNEKHNEANGEDEQRRREPQPVVELRRRGRDRRPGRSSRCAAQQQRNFLATLLLSQGVPMIAARRRDRPHAARQQQRLLPGQRARRGSTGQPTTTSWRCSTFTRRLAALRRDHPVFRRRRFFKGRRAARQRRAARRHRLVHARRRRRWTTTTGTPASPSRSPSSSTARRIREPDARGERGRRRLVPAVFNAHSRGRSTSPLPDGGLRRALGGRDRHRRAPRRSRRGLRSRPASHARRCGRGRRRPAACSRRRTDAGRAAGPARPTGCSCTPSSASTRPPARGRLPARLGVSHVYLSPSCRRRPARTHGYDVVDHSRLNAELGGRTALRPAGRGAARPRPRRRRSTSCPTTWRVPTPEWLNAALWSVLRDGPRSPYARWFDVDWSVPDRAVLMPVLGAGSARCSTTASSTLDRSAGRRAGAALLRARVPAPARAPQDLPLERAGRPAVVPARALAGRRRGAQLPALLRRRHAGRRAGRGPGGLRRHPRAVLASSRDGALDGLRIDHPDGLADPRGYLRRLARRPAARGSSSRRSSRPARSCPRDWPCAGTTGLRRAAARSAACSSTRRGARRWPTLLHRADRRADRLRRRRRAGQARGRRARPATPRSTGSSTCSPAICHDDIALRDHTRRELRGRVVELLVAFDRSTAPTSCRASRRRTRRVEVVDARRRAGPAAAARGCARRARPGPRPRPGPRAGGGRGRGDARGATSSSSRFQQTCGPVMAKGVEDTAFYRWFRLVALNEVGGDPAHVRRVAGGVPRVRAPRCSATGPRP